jgi:Zn-dependent M16 (insulinase) family peptidase
MHSGGFYNDIVLYGKNDGGTVFLFENDIKVFYDEMEFAFDVMEEMLNETDFSDTKRLYEIISERKSKLRMKLISTGHVTAITRANSYMTEAGTIKDMTTGIGYYYFLEDIEKNFEEKKEEVVNTLNALSNILFTRKNLIVSFTSEEEGYQEMEKYLPKFITELSTTECREKKIPLELVKLNEGIKIPSAVSYVARIGNFKKAGYEYTGTMETLKNILDYDYLWNNVRVKGGAYGVMSSYGATSGNVVFVSYRDPNVAKTNDIFNGIPEFLRTFDADDRAVLKFIIGTISAKDTPKNPSAKGRRSFAAYLSNVSYEDICREREEILSLDVEKVRNLAPIMEAVLSQDYICAVGNSAKIEEDKELFMETKDLF